ncbi:MAG: type II secretion system protein [Desulfobacterales bacterium]|nr:MAG: type II secretion system protein [Desulfobacterales bacterium]
MLYTELQNFSLQGPVAAEKNRFTHLHHIASAATVRPRADGIFVSRFRLGGTLVQIDLAGMQIGPIFVKKKSYWRRQEGFTLIELLSVMIIISVLAAVAIQRFILLSENVEDRALVAGIKELNVRETLTWTNVKLSPNGWDSDEIVFSSVDKDLGSEYSWNSAPKTDGGKLSFKSRTINLIRDSSTAISAGKWH